MSSVPLSNLRESRPTVTRVQLDMPTARVEALDALVAEAGFSTRKELFANALTLLEWAAREARRGRAIGSVDDDNARLTELQMPFLNHLKKF